MRLYVRTAVAVDVGVAVRVALPDGMVQMNAVDNPFIYCNIYGDIQPL